MSILRYTLGIGCFAALSFLAACSSTPSQPSGTADIYESINDDVIHYNEEQSAEQQQQSFIKSLIDDIRSLYFRQHYDDAEAQAERLVRLSSDNPEAYYWLTRIKLALGDYQQAYSMASQGLNYARQIGLKRELEHLQRQAQMGAN